MPRPTTATAPAPAPAPERARAALASVEDAHGHVARICFKTGPPGRTGIELEWIVVDPTAPSDPVSLPFLRRLTETAGSPPGGSLVTFEPGGQVELSSPPAPDVTTAVAEMRRDVDHLTAALDTAGLVLVPRAGDPWALRPRQLHLPRYDAMEAYFDGLGHTLGRAMMRATAAMQVNVEAGTDPSDVERRWRLLHLVGPTLVAAFANSPRLAGEATGHASTRQAIWRGLDPARTHPPARQSGGAAGYAEYALDAPLMYAGPDCAPAGGVTLRDWIGGARPDLPPPTIADLEAHLSTLFPPVRARGFFEVRYLDAQSPRWWPVPALVLDTVLEDGAAGAAAVRHCEPVADAWDRAAADALADDGLARAARGLFDDVLAALPGRVDPDLTGLVAAFADQYVDRRRSPCDDPEEIR